MIRPQIRDDAVGPEHQPVVAIGNGKGFQLTNPIAFDAGYTTGLVDKTTTAESLGLSDSQVNAQKLKELAESCLDGGNKQLKASACYVAGLALVAQDKRDAARK